MSNPSTTKQVQHRRGTTADHDTFVGAEGEFTFDVEQKKIVAHDGVTAGGIRVATENDLKAPIQTPLQVISNQTVVSVPEITEDNILQVIPVLNGSLLRDGFTVSVGQIEFDDPQSGDFWAIVQYTTPIGTTNAGAVQDTSRGQSVQETVNNSVQAVDTLAELKALPAFDGAHARINLGGRAGPFRATTAVMTAEIASDPEEGIYVAGNGVTWVRQYGQAVDSTPEVKFEWFGAVGDGVTNNDAACEAAYTFGGRVNVTHGAVFGIQNITVPSGAVTVGSGTIKWLNPDTNNMFELQDVDGTTFDGVTIDVNNVDGNLVSENVAQYILWCKGAAVRGLRVLNCHFKNCWRTVMLRHEDNTLASYDIKLSGNIFDAGTDTRHNTHFDAGLQQMYGFECTHNVFRNLACVATTVSSGHTQIPDDMPGDFIITNNIATGFFPNSLSDGVQQSMFLIRSTTSGGVIPNGKFIFTNNIVEGGKKGLSFAEEEDQTFSEVIISQNIFKNNINGGVSVGRNNVNQEISSIIVSINVCTWDYDYLDVVSPGVTDKTARLISIEAPNVLCQGNHVENCPESGIFVFGQDCTVSGNTIKNCATSQNAMDENFSYGGGIWLYIAPRCTVIGNKVIGGGYSDLDTKRAHGIAVQDNPNNKDILISNNHIENAGDKLVTAISLSRFSSGDRGSQITVTDNHLIGFENSGKIVSRSPNLSDNLHHIYNNKGWGYEEILWNPGTVAAGATVTVTIPTKDGYALDDVNVRFDGFRVDSVGNPSQWGLEAVVTTSSYFWANQVGVITVYLTNNTGSSQTFTKRHRLKVWLDRRNDSAVAFTHSGANNAATLTDSTQSWVVDELVGDTVTNITDGSSGTITANTATTVTATLAGGTDNDWDTGDEYTIS